MSNIFSAEAMRAAILKAVDALGGHGATFMTFQREVPGFSGPQSGGQLKITHPKFSSWTLWEGLTDEAAMAIERLLGEGVLIQLQTSAEIYVADGGVLPMPLVNARRQYPQEHWLPVSFGRPEVLEKMGKIKRKRPQGSPNAGRQL